MATRNGKRIPRGFYSLADVAKICGVTKNMVVSEYLPELDDEDVHEHDGTRYVRAASVVFVVVDRAVLKERRRHVGRGDGDTKNPTERKRHAEARMKELDVLEREGKLVAIAEVSEPLLRCAEALRKVGTQFARRKKLSGTDAQKMLNAALDKLILEVEDL